MSLATPILRLGGINGWPAKDEFLGASGILEVDSKYRNIPIPIFTQRNSKAYVLNSEGLYVPKVVNFPAVTYEGNALGKYIHEKSETNIETSPNGTDGSNTGGISRAAGGTSPTSAGNEGVTVTEHSGSGEPFWFKDYTVSNGVSVTASYVVYFEPTAPSTRQIRLQVTDAFSYAVLFNQDGTSSEVSGTGTHGVIDLGNGFYRIWVSGVTTTTNFRVIWRLNDSGNNTYTGTGVAVASYWCRQVEEAPYPTSPMPENSATRAAAVLASNFNQNISDLTEGVWFLDMTPHNEDADLFISLSDEGSNNRITLGINGATTRYRFIYAVGGVKQCDIAPVTPVPSTRTRFKIAARFSTTGYELWVNGAVIGSEEAGSLLAAKTLKRIGVDNGAGVSLGFCDLNELGLYKPLTDSEIATLTSL